MKGRTLIPGGGRTQWQVKVEYRAISKLQLFRGNARTHSKRQLEQIAKSIEAFGFTNPVLVDEHGTILAGHGRVNAARRPDAVTLITPSQAMLDAILRQSLTSFVAKSFNTVSPGADYLTSWHIRAIAWHLEEVRLGRIRRLIITMPPRSLKSIAASVAFPAWLLGHDPRSRIVCVSYSSELATEHANDFRAVLRSEWYKRLFPGTRIHTENDTEVTTTARGSRLSTSTSGTLTGRGGRIIIIDDPLKPADAMSELRRQSTNEWFSHTLLSRMDDKREGAIVIVMQRLHQDDLVGHVQELNQDWTVLSLPAIAETDHRVQIGPDKWKTRRVGDLLHPEREPLAALNELKAALGSDFFAAQYQQSPVPPGGAAIKRDWIRRYRALPERGRSYRVVQSWDTAVQIGKENDWSVGTTWLFETGEYYLVNVVRKQLEYPDLKREVVAAAARYEPETVLIENTALGSPLVQELGSSRIPVLGINPERDKLYRLAVQASKFEGGQVLLPEQASWLPDLETELFSFPQSRHDDQVDAISQFLEWVSRPRSEIRIRRL